MTKKNKTKSIMRKQIGSIPATVMIIPSCIPPFYRNWVHKTQDEEKQNKDNQEKLAPLGTQDTQWCQFL
jgi:hypothetical protein